MSGTSLDGLDLTAAAFWQEKGRWHYSLEAALTIPYPVPWQKKLQEAPSLSGEKLIELHSAYGHYTGQAVNQFMQQTGFVPGLIASHGHTVFHQPGRKFTFQLGHGAAIAAETGITTVADFRPGDVALGGQGAPLVPAGDRMLFPEYESCLNLGGFANVSFEKEGKRTAFDICPVNFILNALAVREGKPYDKDGEGGRRGTVDPGLLAQLNELPFYRQDPPKSLGREWMTRHFFPLTDNSSLPVQDKLRTVYEHIATQIARTVPEGKMLVTGGGAFNTFLIEQIRQKSAATVVLPSPLIISFKEALIFAFLGVLRITGAINCYASVTGASKDSRTGVVFIV